MLEFLALYTTPMHPILTRESAQSALQGVLFIAILLNAFLFGLISQQFYAYWLCGFKDTLRLKVFVYFQYFVVVLQGILTWHSAYYRYVSLRYVPPSTVIQYRWDVSICSLCQLILIMHANAFLAVRIYRLTSSLFRCGLVMALSIFAFVIGIGTTVAVWKDPLLPATARDVLTIVWHAIQALTVCLITFFLVRVLRKSRSGLHKSDNVVNNLVRDAIQTACLATVWAIAGLVTSIFIPHNMGYRIFDATSGSVYTHAMFDTLISRAQLREKMKPTTFELGWITTENGPDRPSEPSRVLCDSVSQSDPESSPTSKSEAIESHPEMPAALDEISCHQ